jgi:hypothetical protein
VLQGLLQAPDGTFQIRLWNIILFVACTCNRSVNPRIDEVGQVMIFEVDILPIISGIVIPGAAQTNSFFLQFGRNANLNVKLKDVLVFF